MYFISHLCYTFVFFKEMEFEMIKEKKTKNMIMIMKCKCIISSYAVHLCTVMENIA